MKIFSASYHHAGDRYVIHFVGHDWEDAELQARRLGLEVDGILYGSWPIWIPGHWVFATLNLVKSLRKKS